MSKIKEIEMNKYYQQWGADEILSLQGVENYNHSQTDENDDVYFIDESHLEKEFTDEPSLENYMLSWRDFL